MDASAQKLRRALLLNFGICMEATEQVAKIRNREIHCPSLPQNLNKAPRAKEWDLRRSKSLDGLPGWYEASNSVKIIEQCHKNSYARVLTRGFSTGITLFSAF